MIFSSVTFLFYFLPAFLILYRLTPFKNVFLLFASLLFYTWGEVEFVAVMLLSCLGNYWVGRALGQAHALRKPILIAGLVFNVGILVTFKYLSFFVTTLNVGLSAVGISPLGIPDVHLPLGISFFTFQAITYLVDVYRSDAKPARTFADLALYISMFPQLVAGPIVRYQDIARDIQGRTHSATLFGAGIKIFSIGLAQKMLLANVIASPADEIFAMPIEHLSTPLAWFGIVCYTLQIYFDFGGYSNMAIGLGLMMGFHFPKNFNYPYTARSLTDFWRRWHMTLSQWFRDYLYIPLGGNRYGAARTYVNLWIVFLLCGLWHGASWTFIVWGCFHGCFMVLERLFLLEYTKKWWIPFQHGYALLLVMIGWVFFRSDTLLGAVHYLLCMVGMNPNPGVDQRVLYDVLSMDVGLALTLGIIASLPVLPWLNARIGGIRGHIMIRDACALVFVLGVLFLSSMTLAAGAYNPFIYFRF